MPVDRSLTRTRWRPQFERASVARGGPPPHSKQGTGEGNIDAAIVDETTGERDPDLDMFRSENGFDADSGCARYSADFLKRYFKHQCLRMNRLAGAAQERLDAVERGQSKFADDDLIIVPGIRGEPACVDLELAAVTQAEYRLLPQGTPGRIRSNRLTVPGYATRNQRFRDGGTVHTLRSFLSYRVITGDPSAYDPDATVLADTGLDLTSSNTTTAAHAKSISIPLLVTASTADTQVHLPSSELLLRSAGSQDKQALYVHGAEHDMTPISDEAGDTRRTHAAAVVGWLFDRYLPSAR